MQPTFIKPWEAENPLAQPQAQRIASEQGRWEALLKHPIGLLRDPYRYGPLTTSGYFDARRSWSTGDDANWPQEAVGIAALLKTAGADHEDAAYVAMRHINFVKHNDNLGLSEIFRIHLALLDSLSIPANHEELVKAVESLSLEGWNDELRFEDFMYGFDTMLHYLPTAEDETKFLEAWLPNFKSLPYMFGFDESLGLAMAAKFTRADPQSLIEWCKSQDDQVGLGYLVWQERYTFKEWLLDVVQADDEARDRGYSTNEDENLESRLEEQLMTFRMLHEKLPKDVLREQVSTFYAENTEVFEEFLTNKINDVGTDDWFKWIALFDDLNILPPGHHVFTEIWPSLIAEQEKTIAALESGNLSDSKVARNSLHHDMHHLYGPIAMEKPFALDKPFAIRSYIVNDMVLRANERDLCYYVRKGSDPAWMLNMPVARTLLARLKGGMTFPDDKIVPMYPFMNGEDKVLMAEKLLELTIAKQVRVDSAVGDLERIDPVNFNPDFKSPHKGLAKLMHRLTNIDPGPLFQAMEALDLKDSDPLYVQMTKQWLCTHVWNTPAQLAKRPNIAMPSNIGDETLGY